MTCDECGARLHRSSPDRCPACGAEADDHPAVRPRWRTGALLTGAAAFVGLVSLVTIGVVGVESRRTPADSPPRPTTPISPVLMGPSWRDAVDEVNPPLTTTLTVARPEVWGTHRYRVDGASLVVDLRLLECERSDGTITAGGTITNATLSGQTLDYSISVDVTRPITGSVLFRDTVDIDALEPGATTSWKVTTRTTQSIKVRCTVTSLEAAPSER